jgi:hypothetical protein
MLIVQAKQFNVLHEMMGISFYQHAKRDYGLVDQIVSAFPK